LAAARFSSAFSDNITVNLTRNFSALGAGILGQTTTPTFSTSFSNVQLALIGDATSLDDATAIANLPAGAGVPSLVNRTNQNPNGVGSATPYLDNNGDTNNTTLRFSTSNAKALGLVAGNDLASDGSIAFSTSFTWDFDPSDGIASGAFDFVGIATHEIGHMLGFISGVDTLDTGSPLNETALRMSVLDLYRYSTESVNLGANDFTADTRVKYFSLDGGLTNLAGFSTGVVHGDGRQASHWKDALGLGTMDPTAAPGELLLFTSLDLRAFDVIGYDLAVPEPGTLALSCLALAALNLLKRNK
jgi:hypothetical protein